MKLSLPLILTIGILAASSPTELSAQTETPSAQDQYIEEIDDEPVQRVARLSLVEGDVSFLRAGVDEWADAAQNLPLLTGDQIYVGSGSRAEIQLGNGNYIRLSDKTSLTIAELSHSTAQFEVTEGTAIVRLERFGTAFSRFEIDTPNSSLVLEQDGLYRVNVTGAEESEVIVRRGSADVATLDGSFKVREGHRLLIDSSVNGRLEVAVDSSRDDWDRWSYDRDQSIDRSVTAASPDYVTRQETTFNCFYGAGELAGFGSWTSFGSYGYCWIPRVSAGWAPYRIGQWLWVPAVGWSWLSNEPWGWAPYHYGRWAYLPSLGWAWVPGIYSGPHHYNHAYYQWRPALVYFFNWTTPRGQYVGWYPLTPGERWHRSDRRGFNANDRGHLQYPAPRDGWRRQEADGRGSGHAQGRQGVSVLPVAGFARPDRTRLRPGAPDEGDGHWAGRAVRPGLPEVAPSRSASAPRSRRGDDGGGAQPVIAPSPEIAKRPIVTRYKPSGSEVETSAPRERRLVAPRPTREFPSISEGSRHERHDENGNGGSASSNRRSSEGARTRTASGGLEGSNSAAGDDNSRRERRERNRDDGDRSARSLRSNDSEDTGARTDGDQRRRERGRETPQTNGDSANPDDNTRARARSKPLADAPQTSDDESRRRMRTERSQPSDGQSQTSSEGRRHEPRSNHSDQGNGSTSQSERREAPRQERAQPPPEHREQQRQEQHQQKEERRQERQEERSRRKG